MALGIGKSPISSPITLLVLSGGWSWQYGTKVCRSDLHYVPDYAHRIMGAKGFSTAREPKYETGL